MRAHQMEISDADVLELEDWVDRPDIGSRMVIRAQIVLLSADLLAPDVIADRLGIDRKSVYKWRKRFKEGGVPGIWDKAKPGGSHPSGSNRVRYALRASADKLLEEERAPTYDDVKRFCLIGLRETPDDDPRAQYASHGKLKVAWTQLLVDVLKTETDGDDVEAMLDRL